ncbi:DNA gyrase inhibitor YacG [Lichenicola sp.]|uniref:DNA gyrase inhibitor YacG n=1 Tax=Lichenicola sp. TaxID=2804529 RepID=UPI003B003A02
MADARNPGAAGAAAKCPICGRRSEPAHRPFCSVRCADADLGRWLTGAYRVPGPPADPDDPAWHEDNPVRKSGGDLDPEDGLG